MSLSSPEPRPDRRKRWVLLGFRIVVGATLSLMALGLVGQVVRDRSAVWALLMYLPLPLIGLGAVALDLASRGRALVIWGRRFTLTALGLVVAAGSSSPFIAWGLPTVQPPPVTTSARSLSLLHWNVVWGGGRRRNAASWAAIRQTIAEQGADLIVLSEAPPDDWLDEVVADLGPTGNRVSIENAPGEGYWYKLVVASARPLRLVRREAVRNGAAMVVEAQVGPETGGAGSQTVRLLVVDGQSRPTQWRAPFLLDVAAACARAEVAGAPIDLVVGDFNSVGQSLGFDALAREGFLLASRATLGQWRGTFPAFAPVFDIDHVWVAARLTQGLNCRLFTALASDHRGQVVTIHPPAPVGSQPTPMP